ncbi:hypothetical protein J7384_17860 [Endozoicomonas sp. G2_1]|uniref:hypothetical protein n=1 Tax=Endozoicomonas sp. G2_1 TaxID=2821091 RepID=UPI001ADC8FB2|nr:hypothetical protein [Endozoicomonas sp. G2_1]MBO9492232.1 hypothetical protein [Endozoicomonas sp. G2_1]
MSVENQNVELDVDALLASGDEAELLAAIDNISSLADESGVAEQASVAPNDEANATDEVQTNNNDEQGVDEAQTAESNAAPGEIDIDGVLTKDGKNLIPYEVLTGTREELQKVNGVLGERDRQISELQAQLDEQQRLNQLNKQQFEKHDIQAPVLPEHEQITDDVLNNLGEYGEVGDAVRILANQNAILQKQLQQQNGAQAIVPNEPSQAEVEQALAGNSVLNRLFQDEGNRDKLIAIDNQLRTAHPDMAIADRFDLVVATYSQQQVQPQESAPGADVPNSIADANGSGHVPDLPLAERLVAQSDNQLVQTLDAMGGDQLNDLLNELG